MATVGPVAALMCFPAHYWGFATGDILDVEDCMAECDYDYNHAVVVVGYGTDNVTGKDYWLIKNSVGTSWGDQVHVL